jgi:DNA polymerase-1
MLFYATGPLSEKDNWKGFTTRDKEDGYKRSLEEVADKRLDITLNKEERSSDWGGEISPYMVEYAAKDAAVLLPLKDKMVSELEDLGMGKVVELEARFTPSMAYAADNGFALDLEGWKQHAKEAREALEEAEAECNRIAPDPPEDITNGAWAWNASNHRKVGRALEPLGATVDKHPNTGNYITNEVALKAIKKPAKAKRLAEAILHYRLCEKYVTTWGENWFREPWLNKEGRVHQTSPDHLIVVGDRVYAKFNELVATGRGSSRQPNMRNLPPEIRRYFVAPTGRKLLVADYSQIEYIAAAYNAGDEVLLAPLREALEDPSKKFDFHSITAEMIGTDRSTAKTVNFAILYGMSAKNLAKKLDTTEKKAQGYIDTTFSKAPNLHRWWLEQGDKAHNGVEFTTTRLGRRRLVDLTRKVPRYYAKGQEHHLGPWRSNRSQLLNHPIQGACADGYKLAGALIWERRKEFAGNPLLVNMVHASMLRGEASALVSCSYRLVA